MGGFNINELRNSAGFFQSENSNDDNNLEDMVQFQSIISNFQKNFKNPNKILSKFQVQYRTDLFEGDIANEGLNSRTIGDFAKNLYKNGKISLSFPHEILFHRSRRRLRRNSFFFAWANFSFSLFESIFL